jgi:hypothetical protein
MNTICEHKYNQFKNILSGCRTIYDAYCFVDIYSKKNPEMKNILLSMVNGKRYENIVDFRTIKQILEDLSKIEYYEDAQIFLKDLNLNDKLQLNMLQYYSKNKKCKIIDITKLINIDNNEINTDNIYNISKNDLPKIEKKCPHCSHTTNVPIDTNHIVCGFGIFQEGYDWNGCLNDWCFQCEKMLCKTWDKDSLMVPQNRIHNSECCKKHAIKNNKIYPVDYCMCNNWYVQRLKK